MTVTKQLPFGIELAEAFSLQQAGKFADAEALYGRIVAMDGKQAQAWHLLGLCRQQQGDSPGAVDAISRAITLDASQPVYFNNYGAALQGVRRCPDVLFNLSRDLNQLQPVAARWVRRPGDEHARSKSR